MYSTAHKKQHYEQFSFRLRFCGFIPQKGMVINMKILNENFKLEKDVMENGEFYVYTGEETSYSYLEFACREMRFQNGRCALRNTVYLHIK